MEKIMDIRFPHLGIEIAHLGRSITIGGFSIAYYGMIIALGMILGFLMASWQAKRTGQNQELYLDLAVWDIIFAIIGARIYYVVFSWDYYAKHPVEILNTWGGGLAIYGGVIAGVITTLIFAKIRKQSFLCLVDTACAGLLVGQIIGRWGNFFNREAFGSYTNSLFAMQIPTNFFIEHGRIDEIVSNGLYDKATYVVSGNEAATFIQVHPTFLYESMWNLVLLLLIIFFFTKRKKFDGELIAIYCIGYGIGRFLIEGLRTDSLMIGSTGIRVSQILALILAVLGTAFILYKRKKITK